MTTAPSTASVRVLLACLLVCLAGCAAPEDPPGDAPRDAPRPAEEITYEWDGTEWAPSARTLFSYDRADGEPSLTVHQAWREDGWADVSKEEWTLDAQGRQATAVVYEETEGAWSAGMDMAFVYDDAGNKTTARRRVLREGGAVDADSLVSVFEDGLETERRFYRWSDGAWSEVLRQTSTYGPEGLETERVHLAPGDDGWEAQRRWTFEYDDEGRTSVSLVEEAADGAWTPWLRQSYMHDAQGNRIEVVHEERDGAGWTNWMRNETRYEPAP